MNIQNPFTRKVAKVKRKKVTARDIQENISRIMEAMKRVPEGSDDYEKLSKELEHEYVILRKYKDSRFYVEPQDYLKIGGVVILTGFFVCLEREVPAATKFCNTVLKLMPFKG